MYRLTARFIDCLIAWRLPLLIAGALLAAAAYLPARGMKFDRSIDNMFAPTDPIMPPYRRLKAQFGGNEVVLAVYSDPELLHPDGRGIRRLAKVSDRLKKVPGVKDVLSLAEVNSLLENLQQTANLTNLLGFGSKDQWKGPAILNPQSELAAGYRELFAGYTHGRDGQTVAVACMLNPTTEETQQAQDSRADTIESLGSIIADLPDGLPPGVLAGEPVMITEGFKLLEADGRRLGIWSTLLVGLTIVLCFRSLRWLLVPIVVVQWTLVVTQAALALSGLQLTMVSSMLTAIVTVVGVATVVHLIVRFRELRSEGVPADEALRTSGTVLAWPIIGAIMTDVAGFGSLWISDVGPVQDFGTMMVVGSLLVLPAIALLVPGLALMGAKNGNGAQDHSRHTSWAEGHLDLGLSHLVELVQRKSKTTATLTLLLAGVAAIGACRLEVESDFTRNFRSGSRIIVWYEFVETHLGGAGVWDVLIPAPDRLDEEYLEQVRKLETELRKLTIPGDKTTQPTAALTKVISLVDVLDAGKGDKTLAAMPTEIRVQGMAVVMPTFMGALQGKDEQGKRWLRIMLRAPERQPAEQKEKLIEQVTQLATDSFPPKTDGAGNKTGGAEVTGFFVLLTNLIASLLRDQWISFAITTAGVAGMILIAFRSPVWTLIALVPNALPILMVMGLLGWLGLRINMGAAMIAAVSMGLSVDSSIHYLASYQRERKGGKKVAQALNAVQQSVGRAAVLSTLALIVGFMVLCTSEFVPTVYFGALVSLAMLGGLAGNLIVLPLLLSWVEKD